MSAAWAAVRRALADQREAQERLALINRPWLEDFLHWGADGVLHGHVSPPVRRSGRFPVSVTSDGWCPGLSARVDVS